MVGQRGEVFPPLVNVTRQLGDAISDAVREFAASRKWEADHYELWYHDSPIWILRDAVPFVGGTDPLLVRRIQLAAFDTPEGPQLVGLPDAFSYNPGTMKRVGIISQRDREKGKAVVDLRDLQATLLRDGREKAKDRVRGLIDDIWQKAEALSRT